MLKTLLFIMVFLLGCRMELDVEESPDRTVTGDVGPQGWAPVPGTPSARWEKIDEGVATSDNASTAIVAKGVPGNEAKVHFSTADAPANLQELIELRFRFRGRWDWSAEETARFEILFEFFTDGGATLVGMHTVDLQALPVSTWSTYGWYSIAGLSLTKTQADDLTVRMTAFLPDFPTGNDLISLSAFDFRYVYMPLMLGAPAEACLPADFQVARGVPGSFRLVRSFDVTVPRCEVLTPEFQDTAPPLGLVYSGVSLGWSEISADAQFNSVLALIGSFHTHVGEVSAPASFKSRVPVRATVEDC